MDSDCLALPVDTLLMNRYVIKEVIGAGGFGITYKAYDYEKKGICAIKEFVPLGSSMRDENGITLSAATKNMESVFQHGKKRFLEEAEIIEKLQNLKNVVRITDFFVENGTCYYVMEYLVGNTLKRVMKAMGGKLSVEDSMFIITEVAKTMEQIHKEKNFYHRDLSPENIFITYDDNQELLVKVIDFGNAKSLFTNSNQNLTVVLKPGFAPPEQYSSKGKQGAHTDVYALAGTLYYILSGKMIPPAPDRLTGLTYESLHTLDPSIGSAISKAVDHGLELDYRKRTPDMTAFLLELLEGAPKKMERQNSPFIQMYSGKYAGRKWQIPCNCTVLLGRSHDLAQIVVDDNAQISKVHCEIMYDEQSKVFYVEDCSTNGTYINERRLEKNYVYVLNEEEKLTLGNHVCSLKVGWGDE